MSHFPPGEDPLAPSSEGTVPARKGARRAGRERDDQHGRPLQAPGREAGAVFGNERQGDQAFPTPLGVPGYEILSELGRGGMGVVYKARQASLKRLVALKMISAAHHASTAERARFRAEALSVARLQHPGIVQIHEVGEHDGLPYFSLEYCSGGTLAARLRQGPLSWQDAVEMVASLAEAVQAAHQAGILHRDLKPANVLLTEAGQPKIADFGLAKTLDQDVKLTASGAVLGTPSYMAPEQASGQRALVGPTVDVYALGAVLYELLTGQPPFQAPTPVETILQVLQTEPVAVRQHNPAVPREVEAICMKCLQKQPGDRYGSAAELALDLRRFQEGKAISIPAPWLGQQALRWLGKTLRGFHDRWLTVAVLGACILALLAPAWGPLLTGQGGKAPPEVLPYFLLLVGPTLVFWCLAFVLLIFLKVRQRLVRTKVRFRSRREEEIEAVKAFLIKDVVQTELFKTISLAEVERLTPEAGRRELRPRVERLLAQTVHDPKMGAAAREKLIEEVLAEVLGFGPLEGPFANPLVREIAVPSPRCIQVRIEGNLTDALGSFRDAAYLRSIIGRLKALRVGAADEGSQADEAEGELANGFRFRVWPSPLPEQPPLLHLWRGGARAE